ncbi:hypothetical protein B0H19DRAFT_1067787 [Mycena capillaripes]|nr:hypothetical protein B0H19DRAFT_1067787 [Mycena capillaripes]
MPMSRQTTTERKSEKYLQIPKILYTDCEESTKIGDERYLKICATVQLTSLWRGMESPKRKLPGNWPPVQTAVYSCSFGLAVWDYVQVFWQVAWEPNNFATSGGRGADVAVMQQVTRRSKTKEHRSHTGEALQLILQSSSNTKGATGLGPFPAGSPFFNDPEVDGAPDSGEGYWGGGVRVPRHYLFGRSVGQLVSKRANMHWRP